MVQLAPKQKIIEFLNKEFSKIKAQRLQQQDNKFKQEWYYFPLEVVSNYSGAIAIEHRINQIIYLEMNYQRNVFDKIRLKWFN